MPIWFGYDDDVQDNYYIKGYDESEWRLDDAPFPKVLQAISRTSNKFARKSKSILKTIAKVYNNVLNTSVRSIKKASLKASTIVLRIKNLHIVLSDVVALQYSVLRKSKSIFKASMLANRSTMKRNIYSAFKSSVRVYKSILRTTKRIFKSMSIRMLVLLSKNKLKLLILSSKVMQSVSLKRSIYVVFKSSVKIYKVFSRIKSLHLILISGVHSNALFRKLIKRSAIASVFIMSYFNFIILRVKSLEAVVLVNKLMSRYIRVTKKRVVLINESIRRFISRSYKTAKAITALVYKGVPTPILNVLEQALSCISMTWHF